jgi:hypothetical protein
MNYDSFRVEALIIHEIPRRLKGDPPATPQLSGSVSVLDDDLKTYFRTKVRNSLRYGHDVEERIETAEDRSGSERMQVPVWIREELEHSARDNERFVAMSHELAKYLCECQTASTSEGLLVVVDGTVGDDRAITVLKLQRQEAIQLQKDGGTFSVTHLQNLMMSNDTKVYKAAMFAAPPSDPMLGRSSDEQNSKERVAQFFLYDFLGCRFQEEPSVVTLRYFETASTFIRQRTHAADRTPYVMALVSDMTSNRTVVEPRTFARDHLPTNLVDAYVQLMETSDVPTETFPKDTSRITGKIKRVRWKMKSDIAVSATPADFAAGDVSIEKHEDGTTTITIHGELQTINTGAQ